jgi:hypothetical protein
MRCSSPGLSSETAVALALATAAIAALAIASPGALAATGKADVRLVRLLSDVPDTTAGADSLHDVRVRLVPGNVLVFRKGGEFAALLPIDQAEGATESLRYFYYLEHPAFLWVVPGGKTKGIRTVADGGSLEFNSFRLLWRGDGAHGWIYFPDDARNRGLRFSVVSGQSVDQANPKDTEYWVELGDSDRSGF